MSVVSQPWLISKFIDPVFAISVGFASAALRVQREEKEKYPNQDNSYAAIWKKGVTMGQHYLGTTR